MDSFGSGACSPDPRFNSPDIRPLSIEVTITQEGLAPDIDKRGHAIHPDPMRILIVDDCPQSRSLLYGLLQHGGPYEIVVASSADEAVRRCTDPLVPRETDLDVILLDLDMHGVDGIEACRLLRAESDLRDVPVVIITAKTDVESLAMAFDAGAVDYITKPVRQIELLARVRSVLALKRETDARKSKEQDLLAKNLELQRALREIQVLRGLIKICSVCKKIKNDQGSWQQLELYIRDHSAAEFTHGICAECARDQYSKLNECFAPPDSDRTGML